MSASEDNAENDMPEDEGEKVESEVEEDNDRLSSDEYEEEPELVVHKLSNGLDFVPRTTWRAQDPTGKWPLANPIKCVRMNITKGLPCDTIERCCKRLRKIQEEHMRFHDLADIAYNFMVGGDGRIYEGRGWETEGILVKGEEYLSDKSVVIAFIGNYHKRMQVPPEIEYAADQFIRLAIDEGKLHQRAIKIDHREKYDGFSINFSEPEEDEFGFSDDFSDD